jgi:2'-deoxynucleoside 5'-phosphate N-hydrolase
MKIYFSGSMTLNHSKADFYAELIDYLEKYGLVLNKFVGDKNYLEYSPDYVYNRDTTNLDNADILIADLTYPSLGVGFELGYFSKYHKPMLFLSEKTEILPSSLVRGIPTSQFKIYQSIEEAKQYIDNFIKNAK